MPPNLNQTEFQTQDVDPSKREDSDADVWGIKGLLGIIKIEDSDKSKLALGVDLTSLGLNMNQPEYPPQTLAIWGGTTMSLLTFVVFVHCSPCSILHGKIYLASKACPTLIPSMIYQHVTACPQLPRPSQK